jgi:hypothetical protein
MIAFAGALGEELWRDEQVLDDLRLAGRGVD